MKRVAPLLLLLFSAWLLALPGTRVPKLHVQTRVAEVLSESIKIAAGVEHALVELGKPQVAPAAAAARLPAALPFFSSIPFATRWRRTPLLTPPDLRQALRRLLPRRRLPRLSSDDPPWH